MGYVFDFNDARADEKWHEHPNNRLWAQWSFRLMSEMLGPIPGQSVVDIGCGTGHALDFLLSTGLRISGVDASSYVLDIAENRLKNHADLYCSKAEDLPFEDNSFNYAVLFNTLEFVEDPDKSLEEACRVAKDKLFVAIINRFGTRAIHQKIKGVFGDKRFKSARFFSIWEIKRKLTCLLGDVPMKWQNLSFPFTDHGVIGQKLNRSIVLRHFPFARHIGLVVTLTPRYRVRPLELSVCANQKAGAVLG
jgi:ubiquinone/menaquinone biosynthesis C-methylase UbiE